MLYGGIERSLEIADGGRQGEDCLLADLLLGVRGGHADEGGDSADYEELGIVSMFRECARDLGMLTRSCVRMLFWTAVPQHHAA